jgi:methionyl-tRNA synthetase
MTFTSDGDFSRANLIRRHNDDLGNDLGNLLNRVVSMIRRYRDGIVPAAGESGDLEADLREVAETARLDAARLIESWELDDALDAIWLLIRRANQYLEGRKPWSLAKNPEDAALLETTLYTAAEATRIVAILLAPYMPTAANGIMAQLGLPTIADGDWDKKGTWGASEYGSVDLPEPLFPRIEHQPLQAAG